MLTEEGAVFCFLALERVDCLDSSLVTAGEETAEREVEEEEEGEEEGGLEPSSDLRFCDPGVEVGEGEAEELGAFRRRGGAGAGDEEEDEGVEGEGEALRGGDGEGDVEGEEWEVPLLVSVGVEGAAPSLLGGVLCLAFTLSFHCAMMALAASRTCAAALASDGAGVEEERVSLLTSSPTCVEASTCALMSACCRLSSSSVCSNSAYAYQPRHHATHH